MLRRVWNSAVFWSFGVTALRTGGFLFILPLIVRTLPPEELGYWYVLLGLVQAASLLELGFAPTIGRFASYFMGGASTIPATGLPSAGGEGTPPNYAGLAGLARCAERLYRWLALAIGVAFFVFGGGWLFWRYPESMRSAQSWLAFALLGAGSGFAMSQYFWGAMLAGMNHVREQQKIFFIGLVLNYLVVAAGILLGAGIFSLVLGQLVLGLVPRWKARGKVLGLLPPQTTGKAPELSWRILWPSTWRNSLIQACSYLLLPASALTCAATTNLLVTAEYGLTLQMGLMIHGFSACWQAAKYPQLAAMLAAGRVWEVGRIVRTRILLTFLTFGAGAAAAFYLGPLLLEVIRSKTPFLPSAAFVLLLAAIGVDLWSGSFSALLQATNRTPHLPFFCLAAAVGFPLGFVLGGAYGPGGILGACILAQTAFCVWTLPGIWLRQLRGIRPSSLPA
jgi:hypothetical protein